MFHKLNDMEINQIIDIMLKEVIDRLKENNIEIEIDTSVKDLIAKAGIDKAYGARPLRRTIQSLLEDKLAEEILDGKLKSGDKKKVLVENDKIKLE